MSTSNIHTLIIRFTIDDEYTHMVRGLQIWGLRPPQPLALLKWKMAVPAQHKD